MPCHYTGSAEGYRALSANEELTSITNLLCKLCKEIEKNNLNFLLRGAVRRWWKEHKKIDEAKDE